MYVYILNSKLDSKRNYVGLTANLEVRLREHNAGKVGHTSKYKPWKIVTAVWFSNKEKAHKFEKYLKSGSGRAFAKRHF